MPVTQACTAQGKKLLPFFSLDLPNPQRHSRAPWDTRVNPPTLLLLFPPQFDGSLCFPAASPLLRRGHLDPWAGRERHHFVFPQSSTSKLAREKGKQKEKDKNWSKKSGGRGEVRGAACARQGGWRELHLAGKHTFYLLPGGNPSWSALKIKTETSFHATVQCLMLVLENYV